MTPLVSASTPGAVTATTRAKQSSDNPAANALLSVYGQLAPGTDGYVLQSDSTNPLGFSWVGGGGISPTILDAKGDLIVATANDAPARLGVGADGQVLMADSLAAGGVSWRPLVLYAERAAAANSGSVARLTWVAIAGDPDIQVPQTRNYLVTLTTNVGLSTAANLYVGVRVAATDPVTDAPSSNAQACTGGSATEHRAISCAVRIAANANDHIVPRYLHDAGTNQTIFADAATLSVQPA